MFLFLVACIEQVRKWKYCRLSDVWLWSSSSCRSIVAVFTYVLAVKREKVEETIVQNAVLQYRSLKMKVGWTQCTINGRHESSWLRPQRGRLSMRWRNRIVKFSGLIWIRLVQKRREWTDVGSGCLCCNDWRCWLDGAVAAESWLAACLIIKTHVVKHVYMPTKVIHL